MTSNPFDHRLEAERIIDFLTTRESEFTTSEMLLISIAHAILAVR
jgi:hypothetical protein